MNFIFDVRHLDLFSLTANRDVARNKMHDKANEETAQRNNYCFIHLNDGNTEVNGFPGFSDGCIGSWSVGTAGLPNHFAHEMAHLLGYLNVVREGKFHYFSDDITICQHPPIGQLPTGEQMTIMGTHPNRQIIQQDIDNLNFGKGLLIDREFWGTKGPNTFHPDEFKHKFKHGIWQQNAIETNPAKIEFVKKVGQKRPNSVLEFLTHSNIVEIYNKIKNKKL